MIRIFAIRLVIAALIVSAGTQIGLAIMWGYIGMGIHPAIAFPLALMQLIVVLYLMEKQ